MIKARFWSLPRVGSSHGFEIAELAMTCLDVSMHRQSKSCARKILSSMILLVNDLQTIWCEIGGGQAQISRADLAAVKEDTSNASDFISNSGIRHCPSQA